jgi:hypothetical protein
MEVPARGESRAWHPALLSAGALRAAALPGDESGRDLSELLDAGPRGPIFTILPPTIANPDPPTVTPGERNVATIVMF